MRTVYHISDSTDNFKIIFYQKSESEKPRPLTEFQYKENAWVRIIGTVRVFREETCIVGMKIDLVKNHDDITNHFLQIFVAHNYR